MSQGLEFIPEVPGDVGALRFPHEVFLGHPHSQRFSQHGIGMWMTRNHGIHGNHKIMEYPELEENQSPTPDPAQENPNNAWELWNGAAPPSGKGTFSELNPAPSLGFNSCFGAGIGRFLGIDPEWGCPHLQPGGSRAGTPGLGAAPATRAGNPWTIPLLWNREIPQSFPDGK